MARFSWIYIPATDKHVFGPSINGHSEVRTVYSKLFKKLTPYDYCEIEWESPASLFVKPIGYCSSVNKTGVGRKAIARLIREKWPTRAALKKWLADNQRIYYEQFKTLAQTDKLINSTLFHFVINWPGLTKEFVLETLAENKFEPLTAAIIILKCGNLFNKNEFYEKFFSCIQNFTDDQLEKLFSLMNITSCKHITRFFKFLVIKKIKSPLLQLVLSLNTSCKIYKRSTHILRGLKAINKLEEIQTLVTTNLFRVFNSLYYFIFFNSKKTIVSKIFEEFKLLIEKVIKLNKINDLLGSIFSSYYLNNITNKEMFLEYAEIIINNTTCYDIEKLIQPLSTNIYNANESLEREIYKKLFVKFINDNYLEESNVIFRVLPKFPLLLSENVVKHMPSELLIKAAKKFISFQTYHHRIADFLEVFFNSKNIPTETRFVLFQSCMTNTKIDRKLLLRIAESFINSDFEDKVKKDIKCLTDQVAEEAKLLAQTSRNNIYNTKINRNIDSFESIFNDYYFYNELQRISKY